MYPAPRDHRFRYPVALFLALTFVITWSCVTAVAAGSAGLLAFKPSILWMAFLGQFGPAWAAAILTVAAAGRAGLVDSWRSLLRPGFGIGPWCVIVAGPPAAFFASYGVHLLSGGRAIRFAETDWGRFAATLVVGSVVGLVFGGVSEEPGWRGYLLPRLQARMSPLAASVSVGVVWAVWHLEPELLAAGMQHGWSSFATGWWENQHYFLPRVVGFAILMTAIYNRTNGNLLAMVAMHSVANAFESALPEHWLGLGPAMTLSRIAADFLFGLGMLALWRRCTPVTVAEAGRAPRGAAGSGPAEALAGSDLA